MASKHAKRKPQPKARSRNTSVTLSDLKPAKGAAVKGGGTTSTTTSLPVDNITLSYSKVKIEY